MAKEILSRREFLRLSGLTVGGLVLASCAPPPPAATEAAPTEKPTAPAVVKASVAKNDFEAAFEEVGRQWEGDKLVMPWGERDGHFSVCEKGCKRFTELTGIETVWELGAVTTGEKFWLDLASGGGTYDFTNVMFQDYSRWSAVNGLVDLQPYADNPAFPPIDLSKHVPAVLETYGKYKGVLYGIPTLADAMIYVYNLDHLAAAGLDAETPPATWEELYENCKKMTVGEQYGFALMGGRTAQVTCVYSCVFFGLARKGWYNEDGTLAFDSAEGLQAMKIVSEWLTEVSPPAATAWNISDANNAVAQALCSSEIQWPGMMPGLVNPESSKVIGKLGFSAPPLGTALGGHAFGILSTSHNKDATWLAIEYMTSPEFQREWVSQGYAITLTELFEDPEIQGLSPWLKATGDALAVGIGWPNDEDTAEVWAMLDQYINAAVTKEMEPEEALNTMVEQVNALREEGGYIT